ncbi:DUF2971 domain-containing protein [Chitinilyticum piscinae]|uniref:DUF2971 domain-containing protein n=1 Tax=Chitinilyticum piscinae TaxID=2866724 RepID=A0A8J7FI60_9NEIS|nr:DUF2971 domain-containing protein [Chitinilyticum piscinae]MBE9609730.1 DUF2971 domain-containing protein [Chitinilyticum piscinae]
MGDDFQGEGFVSHFTSMNSLIEFIIPDCRIRFSPLYKLNDPKESKGESSMMLYSGVPGDPWRLPDNYDGLYIEHERAKRSGIKVACFSIGVDGASCWRKPRMWAQYAGNSRGACLIFDKKKLVDVARKIEGFVGAEQVYYNDSTAEGLCSFTNISCPQGDFDLYEYVFNKLRDGGDRFLFCKHFDWASESEFRVVVYQKTDDYSYLNICDSLVAVVLGCDAPDIYADILLGMCNVPILKCEWDSELRCYNLCELRRNRRRHCAA